MPKDIGVKIPLLGGIDRLHKPIAIKADSVVTTKNLFPNISGQLEKRSPMGAFEPNFQSPFQRFYSSNFFSPSLYACSGRQPFDFISSRWNPGNVLQVDCIPGGQSAVIGPALNRRPCVFEVGRDVVILPGNEGFDGILSFRPINNIGPDWEFRQWPFWTNGAQTPIRTQIIPVRPRVGCAFQASAVYGNLGPGYERLLLYADNVYPATYQPLSGGLAPTEPNFFPLYGLIPDQAIQFQWFIDLAGGEGTSIVGMAEILMTATGTAVDTALLVLTEFDAFICTGRPELSTSAAVSKLGTFAARRVNYRVGCASHETIARTTIGTLWASRENVWIIDNQLNLTSIGGKLKPYLRNCPPETRWLWHAVYEDIGVYRLIVVVDYTIDTDGSYWPIWEEMWLDLRDGAPQGDDDARWFGPQHYVPYGKKDGTEGKMGMRALTRKPEQVSRVVVPVRMVETMGGDGATFPTVVAIGDVSIQGGGFNNFDCAGNLINGQRWQPSTAYSVGDIVTGLVPSLNGPYICTIAGTSDPDQRNFPFSDGTVTWQLCLLRYAGAEVLHPNFAVKTELTSLDYSFTDDGTTKTLQGLELACYTDGPSKFTIATIENEGTIVENTIGQQASSSGMAIGDTFGTLSEEIQALAIRPSENQRIVARHMQFKLTDDDSFVVDATNNVLLLGIFSNNGLAACVEAFKVTLTIGTYTQAQLLTELQAQLISSLNSLANIGYRGTLLSAYWTAIPTAINVYGPFLDPGTLVNPVVSILFTMSAGGNWNSNQVLFIGGTTVNWVSAADSAIALRAMALFGYDEAGAAGTINNVNPYRVCGRTPMLPSKPIGLKLNSLSARVTPSDRRPFSTKQTL